MLTHLYFSRYLLAKLTASLGFDPQSTGAAVITALGVVIGCIVIPYLLGSCNFAIIFSKIFYHEDIRNYGSGNAGSTNVLRTYGKKTAIIVFICDLLKAAVSVLIGGLLWGEFGAPIAGLFAMVGHMFPIYYRFKGGKGVACSAVIVLMISPITFGILFIIFFVIVLGTKYVSLGSIMGMGLYPVVLTSVNRVLNNFVTEGPGFGGMDELMAVIMAVLVVFMHRGNIKRLMNHTESKVSFSKKNKVAASASAGGNDRDKTEKTYDKDDFVVCAGCKRLIPAGRRVCAYCGKENAEYDASRDIGVNKNKKKKK